MGSEHRYEVPRPGSVRYSPRRRLGQDAGWFGRKITSKWPRISSHAMAVLRPPTTTTKATFGIAPGGGQEFRKRSQRRLFTFSAGWGAGSPPCAHEPRSPSGPECRARHHRSARPALSCVMAAGNRMPISSPSPTALDGHVATQCFHRRLTTSRPTPRPRHRQQRSGSRKAPGLENRSSSGDSPRATGRPSSWARRRTPSGSMPRPSSAISTTTLLPSSVHAGSHVLHPSCFGPLGLRAHGPTALITRCRERLEQPFCLSLDAYSSGRGVDLDQLATLLAQGAAMRCKTGEDLIQGSETKVRHQEERPGHQVAGASALARAS